MQSYGHGSRKRGVTWSELPGKGHERGCTEIPFFWIKVFSGCQGCVEYQTSSLIFMVWGRCLKMGHTSYDMPCPSLVWDHHTTLLLPGLRFVLLILGSFPLHPAYWNPLHLSRPSTSKKTSSTFPSPRAGCSALCLPLCLPQGLGMCPVNFRC